MFRILIKCNIKDIICNNILNYFTVFSLNFYKFDIQPNQLDLGYIKIIYERDSRTTFDNGKYG